jgi:hypothetical protein
MSSSPNDNSISFSLEKPLAYLTSLVFSRQEYQSFLKNQTFFDAASLPGPELVDPDISSTIGINQSIPKLVRSNTRLFLKLYGATIAVQNLRLFTTRRHGGKPNLIFFDSSIAKSSASLAGISLSYKLCYKTLLEFEPVVTALLKTFIETTIPSPEEQLSPSLRPKQKFHWKTQTIIAILSAISSGSLYKHFPKSDARDVLSIYVLLRGLEAFYSHMVNLKVLKPKNVGLKWPLFQLAFSELFHSLVFDHKSQRGSIVNKLLHFLSDDIFPVRRVVTGTKSIDIEIEMPGWAGGDLFEPSWFQFVIKLFLKKYTTVGKYVLLIYLLKALFFSSQAIKSKPAMNEKESTDVKPDVGEQQESIIYFKTVEVLKALKMAFQTTNFLVLPTFTALSLLKYTNYGSLGGLNESLKIRLIGFLSGIWAVLSIPPFGSVFVRSAFLLRFWKLSDKFVGLKKRDDLLFLVGFTLLLGVFEKDPGAISGSTLRKILCWIKSNEFVDPIVKED